MKDSSNFNFENDNIEVKGYIDKRSILRYITEEEIFKYVLKFEPKEFDYICSPLRQDRNPGAFFQRGLYSNKLLFVDWADPYSTHYDCFEFIKRYFKLPNFYSTLKFINQNIVTSKEIIRHEVIVPEKVVREERKPIEIVIEARPFNHTDGLFWGKYGISRDNLKEDRVFAVSKMKIVNSRKGDKEIILYTKCYAYTDFAENRKKLYFPYKKGHNRFLSTCTKNDIITKHLIDVTQLLITKSYKDYRVLRNLGANVVWFQNEGMFPENLMDIVHNYKEVIVFFDNDSTGLQAGEKLVNLIGSKARKTFLPIPLLEKGIKDASDMYFHKGVDELRLFLTKNKVFLYESIRHNS